MRQVAIVPDGWGCALGEFHSGLFLFDGSFGFKSEYGAVFCVDSGECFWGGTHLSADRDKLIVQPVKIEVQDVEA